MHIVHGGAAREVVAFDRTLVEAVEVFGLGDCRGLPVGVASQHTPSQIHAVVGQMVELYVEDISGSEHHYRRCENVAVRAKNLHGLYALVEYTGHGVDGRGGIHGKCRKKED